MAACSAEGAYGRQRLWGALGWGLCSALAGVLITHAGVYAAFACHAVLLVAALPATLRLPFGPLHAKLAAHTQHDDGGGGDGGDGGGGMGGKDGGSKAGTAEQSPQPAAHAASGRRSVERFDSALEAAALLERGAGGHTHAGSCRGGSKGVCAGADEEEAAQLSQQDGSASAAGQQPRVQYWAGVGQLLRCPEAAIFLAMAVRGAGKRRGREKERIWRRGRDGGGDEQAAAQACALAPHAPSHRPSLPAHPPGSPVAPRPALPDNHGLWGGQH